MVRVLSEQASMHRHEGFREDMELRGGCYRELPAEPTSPVNFTEEESLVYDAISDLDRFFERLYNYHSEQGFWCIVLQWVVELLGLAFTIVFSGFFLLFVNWHGLRNAKCGIAAAEAGEPPCDLVKEALYEHPLHPLTLYRFMVATYLVLFTIYWVFCFLRFFTQLKETLQIRDYYHTSLHLTEHDVRTSTWQSVLDNIVKQQECTLRNLKAHDIVMRIMRKENYMIAMVNKGVLALPLPHWLPGVGPAIRYKGVRKRLYLSKTLEWALNWCILEYMFDRNFIIQEEFTKNPVPLRKRLFWVGILMLLLSPFLMIFMLVFFFLRHAEQFYNHPSSAVSRRWTNLAKWTFREFNELEHIFNQRLNASYKPAVEYVRQFPSPIVSKIAKFISFVCGGVLAVLIIIALMDESLLEAHLFGRNLIWLAAVFGTITAISRQSIADENQVFDPESFMMYVAQHTHYMPKQWRGQEYTVKVRDQFEKLFQYTAVMLLQEMIAIVVTPVILIYFLPESVEDILQFVNDFKANKPGVGDVCSMSVFDFKQHGTAEYCSPHKAIKDKRSKEGKMEKSFISFKANYKNWVPDDDGVEFLNMLANFRLKHEPQQDQTTFFPEMSRRMNPSRLFHEMNQSGLFPADSQYSSRLMPNAESRYQAVARQSQYGVVSESSLREIEGMYWLDQYYTENSEKQEHDVENPPDSEHSTSQWQGRKKSYEPPSTGRTPTSEWDIPKQSLKHISHQANSPPADWWLGHCGGSVAEEKGPFNPPLPVAHQWNFESGSDEEESEERTLSYTGGNGARKMEFPFADTSERHPSADDRQETSSV